MTNENQLTELKKGCRKIITLSADGSTKYYRITFKNGMFVFALNNNTLFKCKKVVTAGKYILNNL